MHAPATPRELLLRFSSATALVLSLTLSLGAVAAAGPLQERDAVQFVVDLRDTIKTVTLDVDADGGLVTAHPPGVLASSVDWSTTGLRFTRGVILDSYSGGGKTNSPPNILTTNGLQPPGGPAAAGTFDPPVRAVGLRNLGNTIQLRVYGSSGALLGSILSDDNALTIDFIGLISGNADIARFEVDLVGGSTFSLDDLVFGPPLPRAGFDSVVDSSVKPSVSDVVDARHNGFTVGAVAEPDGALEEFAENGVLFKPVDDKDLDGFLGRYAGAVLGDDSIPPFPPEVIPPSEQRPVTTHGYKLVRIDPDTVALDEFETAMEAFGASDVFRFSSERARSVIALVAIERMHGRDVMPNLLTVPAGNGSCVLNVTQEEGGPPVAFRPTDPPWLDALGVFGPTGLNGILWFRQVQDAPIGIGGIPGSGIGAWGYLEFLALNTPGPRLAVVDGGFATGGGLASTTALGLDDVGAPVVDLNSLVTLGSFPGLNVPNALTCGSTACPWHGTGSATTAAGGIDNRFGAVGPGGQVTSRLLTYQGLPLMADGATGIRAATAGGANVINNSWGATCAFVCATLGPLRNLNDSIAGAIAAGVTVTSSAGNATFNVDSSDIVPCKLPRPVVDFPVPVPFPPFFVLVSVLAPVTLPGNICVGAIQDTAGTSASFSNFGSGVEAWAPGVGNVTAPDPTSPAANTTFGGTSAAAPFIAGVVMMMQRVNPTLTAPLNGPANVEGILKGALTVPGIPSAINASVDPLVTPGFINGFGAVETAAVLAGLPTAPTDSDGDGCFIDNCPTVRNPPTDSNANGAVDPGESQTDRDGDGVGDLCDNCAGIGNPSQANADGDQLGDLCDNCPTATNPDQKNADRDAAGDACDPDDDNDGLSDAEEAVRHTDPYNTDTDGDGLTDGAEVNTWHTDPLSPDTDHDSSGDFSDNCKLVASTNQADADADGFGDICDNCPSTANPGQENNDHDAQGDACDTDDDNDGVADGSDNCPGFFNPNQDDKDGDGVGDACDACYLINTLDCLPDPQLLERFIDIGFALECLGSGGPDCLFTDPRGTLPGTCPQRLKNVDGCCPFGAHCAGPNVSVRDALGNPLHQFFGHEYDFGDEDAFGYAASLLPDLDGGGMLDVVVGAPLADPGGRTDAGSVLVLSSETGAVLSRIDGQAPGDQMGASLARFGAGGSFLAGAPGADPVLGDEGSVFLVGAGGVVERRFDGASKGASFGERIGVTPDLDADGVPDFFATAPGSYPGPIAKGEVDLVSANSGVLVRLQGETMGDGFGLGASFVPDPMGSGQGGIAVGAPYTSPLGLTEQGSVTIYDLKGNRLAQLVGEHPGDHFGNDVSGGGDVDGDGRSDLVIGAPLADPSDRTDAGAAYLFSGFDERLRLLGGADAQGQAGGHFGRQVLLSPDVGGDGLPDAFVHAPLETDGVHWGSETLFRTQAKGAVGTCGNGRIEGAEECDPGERSAGDCCSDSCKLLAGKTVCRSATGSCDHEERCGGLGASCPFDLPQPEGDFCDDGTACTSDDHCTGFVCGGTPVVPGEVAGVRFLADRTTLQWNASAAAYDVATGNVGSWPVGQPGEACLANSIPTTSLTVTGTPMQGKGSWYLVRGQDSCGNGSYGQSSGGSEHNVTACP